MRKKDWLIILLLAALKMVLPFLLSHPAFGLHRDEYLYFEQGHHLALGYLENPALIGWLASISSLLGGSFLWIKFWPAVVGAATLMVTAGITKELGGRSFALLIAGLGIICSGYLRVHFLFQPNFLEIFFWTLGAYFLLRYINTQQHRYLYLLFAALALGLWSKYSVVFFAAAMMLSILPSPHRKMMAKKHFWLAALLGVALAAPNIYWQATHNWPLLHHMEELRETQLQHIDRATFFKEQLLMLLPVAFVWIGGLIWLLLHKKYRLVGLTYLFCVGLIAAGSGKGYYTLGAYPMLLAAGGVWLEQKVARTAFLRAAFIVLIVALTLPIIPLLLPLRAPQDMARRNEELGLKNIGILRWEDLQDHPLQQDFADMIGWDELAQKAEKAFLAMPDSAQQNTVVYCRSYGQAGALKYHAKDPLFRSKIICDNGTFLLWIPDSLSLQHLLFVGRDMPDKDDAVFQQFASVHMIDSVTNPLSRQYGDKIILFKNANERAAPMATQGLDAMKAQFGE